MRGRVRRRKRRVTENETKYVMHNYVSARDGIE